jgi:hypothetical protein
MNQLGIKDLKAIYMMRPYLTRHGAGPLPGEVDKLRGIEVIDGTNKDGPWQGKLRLAPINADLIHNAIATDLLESDIPYIEPYVGISCIDQGGTSGIFNILKMGYPLALTGHGPRRDQYHIKREFKQQKPIRLVGSGKEVISGIT